jgi:hypothetical protein
MAHSSAETQLSGKTTIGTLFLYSLAVLSFSAAVLSGAFSWRGVESVWAIVPLAVGIATLLCVTLPGAALFRRTHNTRYRASFRLSLVTLVLLVIEFVGVFFFSPAS